MQLRHDAQLDAVCQLAAQETCSAIQTLLSLFVFAIQSGKKNLGMRIITRHLNAGDCHQTHAGIIEFKTHQFGYLALDLLSNAVCSRKVRHYKVRATSTIS